MPHFTILKEMFNDSMVLSLEDNPYDSNKKTIKLNEANLYSVELVGLPPADDILVIKTDRFPALKEVFKGQKGECKRADFVIFAKTSNKNIIVYIELKSKAQTKSQQHIIKQLKGAQCVVKYCKEIGREFWNQDFLKNFESRFVCLRNINIAKRTTRHIAAQRIHDTPETMLKINSPTRLQFNQLIGRVDI